MIDVYIYIHIRTYALAGAWLVTNILIIISHSWSFRILKDTVYHI